MFIKKKHQGSKTCFENHCALNLKPAPLFLGGFQKPLTHNMYLDSYTLKAHVWSIRSAVLVPKSSAN